MRARITRPPQSAMQSGKAKAKLWRLEFVPDSPQTVEPLLGWTRSNDTQTQVVLDFVNREAAVAYAQSRGLAYELIEPEVPALRAKAYSDNFRTERKIPWSH
jgi:hypothetical protein